MGCKSAKGPWHIKMRLLTVQLLGVLLLCYQVVATLPDSRTVVGNDDDVGAGRSAESKAVILQLSIDTDIRFRYARTEVTTRVSNAANFSQEVSFSFVLPESAYISGFHIAVDDVIYEAYVREKEAARQEYTEAVRQGRTAGHVAMSARDSQRFSVSVNVEPQKKVNFKLTYEELLSRQLGTYKHVINLDPGQIVNDLKVTTRIEECSNITTLKVPALRMSNEILEDPSETTNSLTTIERPSPESAVIKFWPTRQEQQELANEGIQGQLVVEYDVDRTSRPGEVLVRDGYFVHFFAPADLQPLPKHIVFVLDISGSMQGRKLQQLKEAMSTILSDLNQADFFSIVLFSTDVQVWDCNATDTAVNTGRGDTWTARWGDYGEAEEQPATLAPTVIAGATSENTQKAKEFINELSVQGATNINAALLKALHVSQLSHNSSTAQNLETIIIFLTDGQANVQTREPRVIMENVKRANTRSTSIYTLALGRQANYDFLKKLSLQNSGFARKIYEASDTALQLRNFYRQVASPLLANVTFRYEPDQVVRSTLTQRTFRRIFAGSEAVVAGRLTTDNLTSEVMGRSVSGMSSYPFVPKTLPPVDTNSTVSYNERLWAYLTIQQLLDKRDGDVSDDSQSYRNYTDEALQLALRYSFVTPLTSLIVVKPNENATSVNTKDASVPAQLALAYERAGAGAGQVQHSYIPAAAGRHGSHRPVSAVVHGGALWHQPAALPRPDHNTSSAGPRLVSGSDAQWFSADWTLITLPTGVNGTNERLQLATANETNVAYDTCSTPEGQSGHCRHLRLCVLDVFTASQTNFLPYFCRISASANSTAASDAHFVGACCPDILQQPAK